MGRDDSAVLEGLVVGKGSSAFEKDMGVTAFGATGGNPSVLTAEKFGE